MSAALAASSSFAKKPRMRFLKPFFWLGCRYDTCTYASHFFTILFHVTPVNLKVSTQQLERLNSDRQRCYATMSTWLLAISASTNMQDLALSATHTKLRKTQDCVQNHSHTTRQQTAWQKMFVVRTRVLDGHAWTNMHNVAMLVRQPAELTTFDGSSSL